MHSYIELKSRIAKPERFGLGTAPKKNFQIHSTKFIFFIIKLLPGHVWHWFIRKEPHFGELIYEITWKHALPVIFLVYLFILKVSIWAYNLMVNNIVRSQYNFVESNKIETLFSNFIFGLTFQSPSSKFIYLLVWLIILLHFYICNV